MGLKDYAPPNFGQVKWWGLTGFGFGTAFGASASALTGAQSPLLFGVAVGSFAGYCSFMFSAAVLAEIRLLWEENRKAAIAQGGHVPELPPVQDAPQWSHYRATGKEPENRFDSRVHVDSRSLVQPALPQYVTVKKMVGFAHGVLYEYCDLSHKVWERAGSPHKTFSRPAYDKLTEYMRGYGLIAEINGAKQNGYEMTTAGRAWLESIIRVYHPALLKN